MRLMRLRGSLPEAYKTGSELQVNPEAAYAFATDAEMDARFDRVYNRTRPALHCQSKPPGPELHGLGFYAHYYPQSATSPPYAESLSALTGRLVPWRKYQAGSQSSTSSRSISSRCSSAKGAASSTSSLPSTSSWSAPGSSRGRTVSPTCTTGSSAERSVPPPSPSRRMEMLGSQQESVSDELE